MKKAVFLDRDGTLTSERNYTLSPEEIKILPQTPEAIKILHQSGFLTIVVTNQSCVGKGLITLEELHRIHHAFLKILEKEGASIDAIYFCPHHPDAGCKCRKPSPELIFRAAKDYNIDLSKSYLIGDQKRDIEMGKRAGLKTVMVLTGYGEEQSKEANPDFIAKDVLEAAKIITQLIL